MAAKVNSLSISSCLIENSWQAHRKRSKKHGESPFFRTQKTNLKVITTISCTFLYYNVLEYVVQVADRSKVIKIYIRHTSVVYMKKATVDY